MLTSLHNYLLRHNWIVCGSDRSIYIVQCREDYTHGDDFSLYEFYTDAHRVTGVRIKPPSHEANIKALLGRETRNLEKNPSLVQLVGLEPVASHTTVECFNHLATQSHD